MLKKITTVISGNKHNIGRKVRIIGGVVAGICIGILLNHNDDTDDVFVVGEVLTETDDPQVRDISEMSQEEIERADRNIAGEA